jgi:DNA-binding GntR family transcriptional regulator
MYRVFESDLGLDIEHATQTISASLANRDDAKLLGVTVGSALISLERLTTSSEGRPLEFLRSAYCLSISASRSTSHEGGPELNCPRMRRPGTET